MSEPSSPSSLGKMGSCLLGLEALEGVDLEVLDKGVELLLGVLILVLLSADSHTDLAGHITDALAPHESVQAGVHTNVLLQSGGIRYIFRKEVSFFLHGSVALRRERQTGSRMLSSYLGEHLSLGEFPDLSESAGGSLLELDLVESLVEVDGVVSGHRLHFLLLSVLHAGHFLCLNINN